MQGTKESYAEPAQKNTVPNFCLANGWCSRVGAVDAHPPLSLRLLLLFLYALRGHSAGAGFVADQDLVFFSCLPPFFLSHVFLTFLSSSPLVLVFLFLCLIALAPPTLEHSVYKYDITV
jgi:hypothetical protein